MKKLIISCAMLFAVATVSTTVCAQECQGKKSCSTEKCEKKEKCCEKKDKPCKKECPCPDTKGCKK